MIDRYAAYANKYDYARFVEMKDIEKTLKSIVKLL